MALSFATVSASTSVANSLILLETLSNTASLSGASAVLAASRSLWMSKYSSLARGVVVGGSSILDSSLVGVRSAVPTFDTYRVGQVAHEYRF